MARTPYGWQHGTWGSTSEGRGAVETSRPGPEKLGAGSSTVCRTRGDWRETDSTAFTRNSARKPPSHSYTAHIGEQWEKQRDHGPGPEGGGVSSTMGGNSAKPPCSILCMSLPAFLSSWSGP
eukprot:scaffold42233_cov77-Phaeocystis_antarctica.AAC.1